MGAPAAAGLRSTLEEVGALLRGEGSGSVDRRRLLAAAFFSVVILLVLGVMVYLQQSQSQQSVTVFVLRHAVLAGGAYSADDVAATQIRAAEGDFSYEHRAPSQLAARYAQSLSQGDVVRDDDLVAMDAQVEVSLTVQASPPLAPGDRVDLFAAVAGGRQARVGEAVTVLTVSGTALTVLVPSNREGDWMSLASSSIPLHAALTSAGDPVAVQPVAPADAVGHLCGPACAGTENGAAGP